mmetsp:Transcript_52905/g.158373  ORF Transcript_52905/g.158373 Transcript_52905/m.158373 type:complete len:126 (+) Transcript_52905:322-699(+)
MLDAKHSNCFPEHKHHVRRPLRQIELMCGVTASRKIFTDDLTDWLVNDMGFAQLTCQGSMCHKTIDDDACIVALSCMNDCACCHASEELRRWFIEKVKNKFNVLAPMLIWWCILTNQMDRCIMPS